MSNENTKSWIANLRASAGATIALLVLCCGVYPLLIWAVAEAVFPWRANGSLIRADGTATTRDDQAVGSALLGQKFTAPQYFHPRPSAAGDGYDAANSSGSNLGPTSAKLIDVVKQRIADYAKENGIDPVVVKIPADAVTASGSGLDPHISPRNAELQTARVAAARNITAEKVRALITTNTDNPDLRILGEPGVNVLRLNLALDAQYPMKK